MGEITRNSDLVEMGVEEYPDGEAEKTSAEEVITEEEKLVTKKRGRPKKEEPIE